MYPKKAKPTDLQAVQQQNQTLLYGQEQKMKQTA